MTVRRCKPSKVLLLVVLLPLLSGCNTAPAIHGARSAAAAIAQLQKFAQSFHDPQDRKDLTSAIDRFQTLDRQPKGVLASPHLPQLLDGMTARDFERFVHGLDPRPDPLRPSKDFPNPQRAGLLLASYQAQARLLEEARDAIRLTGDDTIDEYPIAKVVYVPPQADMPPEVDSASAYFEVGNASGFTAYSPSFRIRIDTPEGQNLLDRTFQIDQQDQNSGLTPPPGAPDATTPQKATPKLAPSHADMVTVPAGSKTLFRWTCCNVVREPMLNALLQRVGDRVVVRIDPVMMKQRNGSDALHSDGYDADDHRLYQQTKSCIAEMQGHLESWHPIVGSTCSHMAAPARNQEDAS